MKVRALRGVCIGVDKHLVPGDTADLPAAEVQFLASIGAVEQVPDEPPPEQGEPIVAAPQAPDADPAESETATPAKAGKKEK